MKEALWSSNEGCKLCQFITRKVGGFDQLAQKQPNALFSMTISRSEDNYGENSRPTQVEMRLNQNQTPIKYDICRVPSTVTDRGFYSPIEKYEEGHPRKADVHLGYFPRLVEQDPLSNATLGLVKDWLATCSSHAFCRAQVPQALPKRLVTVRSDGRLVLTEHHNESIIMKLDIILLLVIAGVPSTQLFRLQEKILPNAPQQVSSPPKCRGISDTQ